MLLAARVDPAGMIGFFDTIRREEGSQPKALTYFSTHPLADERIARLRSHGRRLEGHARAPPPHRGLARPREALLGGQVYIPTFSSRVSARMSECKT